MKDFFSGTEPGIKETIDLISSLAYDLCMRTRRETTILLYPKMASFGPAMTHPLSLGVALAASSMQAYEEIQEILGFRAGAALETTAGVAPLFFSSMLCMS